MAASMTSFSRYLKPNYMYFSLIDFCNCFTKTIIVLDVNECLIFWRKNVHNTGKPLRGLSLPSKRVVR